MNDNDLYILIESLGVTEEQKEKILRLIPKHKNETITLKDILAIVDENTHEFEQLRDYFFIEQDVEMEFSEDESLTLDETDIDIEKMIESEDIVDPVSNLDINDVSQTTSSEVIGDDIVRIYLKEIGVYQLLDHSEEIKLGKAIQEGLETEKLLNDIYKNETNVPLEQIEKYNQIVFQGKKAQEKLCVYNLRLVVKAAKSYTNRGLAFIDLIGEGNTGLKKAVLRFDHTRGLRFSTFATWWIRQAISRAIANQSRTIRRPVHMGELINRYKKVYNEQYKVLERAPTPTEIAKLMNISDKELEIIMLYAQDVVSLDRTVGNDEDSVLADYYSDEKVLTPAEESKRKMIRETFDNILVTLTPKEQAVVRMRFGLDDGRKATLEEVGARLEVTRERIRQIQKSAIRRIKQTTRLKTLHDAGFDISALERFEGDYDENGNKRKKKKEKKRK